jgi:hypothetical protein
MRSSAAEWRSRRTATQPPITPVLYAVTFRLRAGRSFGSGR